MIKSYSKELLEHMKNPKNMGEMEDADVVGEAINKNCGDSMLIYLKVSENEFIDDISFLTFGCGSAVASTSMMTEMLKGKSIKEALNFSSNEIHKRLGMITINKSNCSSLSERALKAALYNYSIKFNKNYDELKGYKPE